MAIFSNVKETIFLKNTSSLQKKYEALDRLNKEYPNNKELLEEFYMVKKGLYGENSIAYQLEKSNLGLFVLRDINIEYEGLKAQIDFVVVTRCYCYFIECKNLIGNITVNDQGDFIREFTYNGKTVKKGMYSPLRQVEAQRDVYKKIWNNSLSKNKIFNSILRIFNEDSFKDIHRVLVVAANDETILKLKYAPSDIKDKVIKSDRLISKIESDLNNSDKSEWSSMKDTENWAKTFLNNSIEDNTDYYSYYKNKYFGKLSDEDLTSRLKDFRVKRAKDMNIKLWYVFNNEELEKLVKYRPKTIDELKSLNILKPIRVKTHGEMIIEIINS